MQLDLFNFDVCLRQNLFVHSPVVEWVKITNPLDSSLNYHLCTQQTRERCSVNCGPHALLSSCLHNSRLLSMKTNTFIQVNSLFDVVIASLAPAFVTVYEPKRCTVVPSRNYSIIFRNYSSIASLHAVGPGCRQLRQFHKVSIK